MRRSNVSGPSSRAVIPMEHLESRRLLAGVFNGTDVDGDQFKVVLNGPGALTVATSINATTGFISTLAYTGTTTASTLSISVQKVGAGDGRVQISFLDGQPGPIKSINAPDVDVQAAGVVRAQSLASLVLGDVGGNGAVVINGGPIGGVTLRFRHMLGAPGQCLVQSTPHVKSLSASGMNAHLQMSVGTITCTGDADLFIEASANNGVSIGSLKVAGVLTGTIIAPNLIKSLTGAQVAVELSAADVGLIRGGADGVFLTGSSGAIAKVQSLGEAAFSFTSGAIGTIDAKVSVAGSLVLRDVSAQNVALGLLRTASVNGLNLFVGPVVPTGLIKSIKIGSWTGGSIHRGVLGRIDCTGDFNPTIDLSDAAAAPVNIDRVTVKGLLSGLWTVQTRIGTISAFQSGNGPATNDRFRIDQGAGHLVIGTMKLGAQSQFVKVTAQAMGLFSSAQRADLVADLDGNQLMGPFVAKERLTATVTCTSAGIGLIRADGDIVDSAFRTLFIDEVRVKHGSTGQIDDCLLRADGVGPSGFSVRKVTVGGTAFDLRLRAQGRVGAVEVGALASNSVIYSGSLGGNGMPADLSLFDPAGRIDSVKITRAFNAVNGNEGLSGSSIVAPTVGSISINGRIGSSSFGGVSVFGIGFRTLLGTLKLRDSTGVPFNPVIPAAPADAVTAPDIGGTDFVIRHFA